MLINEFGSVGIDHDLVVSTIEDDVAVELSTGCLCCTTRGELAATLANAPHRFARSGKTWFERVLIETTGLADPAPILHTLMSVPKVSDRYRLDGVVTTVDAANGNLTLDRHFVSVKQVAVADRLLISKSDLVNSQQLRLLQERLRRINLYARQCLVVQGAIEIDQVLGLDPVLSDVFGNGLKFGLPASDAIVALDQWLQGGDYRQVQASTIDAAVRATSGVTETLPAPVLGADFQAHDDSIRSFCFVVDEPFEEIAFLTWIELLMSLSGENFLRTKGIINIQGRSGPTIIHGVQHLFHPPMEMDAWPSEDRRSRIVFITRDIDEAVLQQTLSWLR